MIFSIREAARTSRYVYVGPISTTVRERTGHSPLTTRLTSSSRMVSTNGAENIGKKFDRTVFGGITLFAFIRTENKTFRRPRQIINPEQLLGRRTRFLPLRRT